MWKHIFGYGNTRFCLRKDTGTMNQPLRLTGCSLAFHGLFVGILRNVRHVIANRSPPISCVFATHLLLEYDVFVK